MNVKAIDYMGWCDCCKCWRLFRWYGELTQVNCGSCGNILQEVKHDHGQMRLNKYAD